jgi:hypothetical protein
LKIFVVNEKIREAVNAMTRSVQNVWATGRAKIMAIVTTQGSVLTNQCLGKDRMLSEGLRNPSFLMDGELMNVER